MERQTQTALACPKDEAPMRSYERSGVVIDRCTEYGGIFLDRGELERLIDAEGRYQAEGRDGGEGEPRSGGRRRESFLGNLLDHG